MRIALMHFHLKTGGVTTVVKQQAACLTAAGHEVLLIVGQTPNDPMPAPVAVVPGLGYDQEAARSVTADACAAEILRHMALQWPGKAPDIIHVHNPTLAKTRRLQAVLKRLRQAGMTLLCQIHDFAEDGRPDVYFKETYVDDCHYAVLNARDMALLLSAGFLEQGVHYLPNAVMPLPESSQHRSTAPQTLLYPVRAIRRKNIGEAILLALYAPSPAPLAITQPPNSPRDIPGYRSWQAFVRQHELPVLFEAGLQYDFEQLVQSCRYVVTTSITEGFGFTFIEPWTAGKALWGRLLPDVCRDFMRQDIRLTHLYTRLLVPLAWMDSKLLRRTWRQSFHNAYEQYGLASGEDEVESGWRRITKDDLIDFGLISEPFQQAVLTKVCTNADAFASLRRINPFLKTPGPPQDQAGLVEHNKTAVMRLYAPDQYGRRLLEIYAKVLAHPVRHTIDKGTLLNFFLTPERLSLLKWRAFDG